jgi:hypothetical protein
MDTKLSMPARAPLALSAAVALLALTGCVATTPIVPSEASQRSSELLAFSAVAPPAAPRTSVLPPPPASGWPGIVATQPAIAASEAPAVAVRSSHSVAPRARIVVTGSRFMVCPRQGCNRSDMGRLRSI